jgi:hypothetical protein
MNASGMWDEADGFYHDTLKRPDGSVMPLRVRSIVGLIPIYAVMTVERELLARLTGFRDRVEWFIRNRPEYCEVVAHIAGAATGPPGPLLLSIVGPERLRRIVSTMVNPDEFLSPYGLRALSKVHAAQPFVFDVGGVTARVDYEPGESTSGLFGGNSNWRGPVWFPVNALAIEALRTFHRSLGGEFRVVHPADSTADNGVPTTLADIADDLARRLVSLFCDDADKRRPVFGTYETFQTNPTWHDLVSFHEYFHGDTGAGLGASHQTGWTGLVIDLIKQRGV